MNLVEQSERELALKRWQLEHQGARIRELAGWLSTRPEDADSLAVGKILGGVVIGYVEDCAAVGVTP